MTLSLAKVDETIVEGGRQMILNFIAAIVVISLMIGALIWWMVNRPVKQLIVGTKCVAAGGLDYKINVGSQDEVGELAASFNRMTGELKRADATLNEWARTLETRVEENTAELKQAHEHILHVERMASIGKLAAIVAHEINNPLAGILVYAKLLLKKASKGDGAVLDGDEFRTQLDMIAATNKNLETMVPEEKFCEDLYYRINVFSITVPPLRERREDIELLAGHFLTRFSHSMNKPVTGLSKEALELLRGYNWPGNVRELQNALERAVLVARAPEIQPGDLPLQLNGAKPALTGKSLSEIERQPIKNVLDESGWNIYRAARLLEIDRVTLYNKIKKYGFKREEKRATG